MCVLDTTVLSPREVQTKKTDPAIHVPPDPTTLVCLLSLGRKCLTFCYKINCAVTATIQLHWAEARHSGQSSELQADHLSTPLKAILS